MTDDRNGGGLDLRGLENKEDAAGGTGGSATGAGQGAGGAIGGQRGQAGTPANDVEATPHQGSLAARTNSEIAAEAGALGPADGSLADAAGLSDGGRGSVATMGESLGVGAGRGAVGEGARGERDELGGGDPLAPPNRG